MGIDDSYRRFLQRDLLLPLERLKWSEVIEQLGLREYVADIVSIIFEHF